MMLLKSLDGNEVRSMGENVGVRIVYLDGLDVGVTDRVLIVFDGADVGDAVASSTGEDVGCSVFCLVGLAVGFDDGKGVDGSSGANVGDRVSIVVGITVDVSIHSVPENTSHSPLLEKKMSRHELSTVFSSP
mmetsp:Transcript_24894/g.50939  ORF Transcript_24894/g.50939 Transcript_24894/m.50939 type:complete len:132 (-) Transcript_24894:160-555(-)